MMDVTLHFAIGLAAGTCIFLPSTANRLLKGGKCARETGRLIAGAWMLGFIAVMPNILRFSGMPESFCNGWWMNIFLLNPLLDSIKRGGMLIGETAMLLLFVLHYSIIVLALARNRIEADALKS